MKLSASTVLIALLVAGAIAVVWAAHGAGTHANVTVPHFQRPAAEKVEVLKKLPVGMSGCLAAACHGGPAEKTLEGTIDCSAWQSSGTCWTAADPHTVAYSLLTENPLRPVRVTAKQIMDRYAPGKSATHEARCLACHTNPALARPELLTDPHARQVRIEGVSCEGCHGNAGVWVSEHTTWKGPRDKVYQQTGMVRLYDIGERALNCAGCHVGAPADPEHGLPLRDMNHDMIAAGHPRLNFDFAEYLRRLPHHWQEKDRGADKCTERKLNDAKVWLVGRVAHAEAACKLLADRVARSKSDERTPWPEFAEFNCAACHHQLRAGSWRQDAEYLGARRPGTPSWQTIWPITPAAGIASPSRADSRVKELLQVAEDPRHPRTGIPENARTAAEALKHYRGELVALPDAEAVKRVKLLFPPPKPGAEEPRLREWDSAAQMFFGLAALKRSRTPASKQAPAEFHKAVEALRTNTWPEFDWRLSRLLSKRYRSRIPGYPRMDALN